MNDEQDKSLTDSEMRVLIQEIRGIKESLAHIEWLLKNMPEIQALAALQIQETYRREVQIRDPGTLLKDVFSWPEANER